MNLNMILRLLLRPLLNRLINKGVNAVFDGKNQSRNQDAPKANTQDQPPSPWDKNSKKRLNQSMKVARRLTRF